MKCCIISLINNALIDLNITMLHYLVNILKNSLNSYVKNDVLCHEH